MQTAACGALSQMGSAGIGREGIISSRISMCEDSQSEIQARIDSLYGKLSNVLMPSVPSGCCDKGTARDVLPPMGDRLENLLERQNSVIAQLTDILQRLEV